MVRDDVGDLRGRAEWIDLADRMLLALGPFRSPAAALVELPGRASWSGPRSDGLEGFARSFLLASLRIAATRGESCEPLIDVYRLGLLAGSDPRHPEAWPRIVDRGQALVEAASIALALHWTRPWLWDRLESAAQERLVDWMRPSAHVATPDNNWVLFPVIVQEFLASVGAPFDEAVIARGIERIEDWYDGAGWYRDGAGQNFDYYNAWALHLYPALWTFLREARSPGDAREHRARYAARLSDYLPQHLMLLDRTGSPVFQGRSLSYRFAVLAPLWLGELLGAGADHPGAVRLVADRTLDFFEEGGAFGRDGVLTSGWQGEFLPMIQPYSGPASPYWAVKGFLGLLLPADAPVWTAAARDPETERTDVAAHLAAPGFLVARTGADGISRLINHGSDHYPPLKGIDDPLYSRLAYSSRTSPVFGDDPVDSHVGVVGEGGRVSRRTAIERVDAPPGFVASAHTPVWPDVDGAEHERFRILTASFAEGSCVVHVHIVTSQQETCREVRVGGWAIASPEPPPVLSLGERDAAVDDGRGLVSRLRVLYGEGQVGVHRASGTSPLGAHAAVPVATVVHRGCRSVVVVAVDLSASGDADTPRVTVTEQEARVVVQIVGRSGTSTFVDPA